MLISLITDCLLLSLVIFLPIVTKHLLPVWSLYVIFFTIGAATGTHPLVFALAKENFSNKIAGTVVAFTNTLVMVGGMIFQPVVGFLLDLTHGGGHYTHFKINSYNPHDYTIGLSVIPISLFICILLMLMIKETGHKLKD